MIIKKYIVKNVNEAMEKIRYELGKDAIIISQRKVKKPGFFGLFSGKLIEVTAAIESSAKEDKSVESNFTESKPKEIIQNRNVLSEEDEFKKSIESIKRLMETEISAVQPLERSSSQLDNMIQKHNANVEKERKNLSIDSVIDDSNEEMFIKNNGHMHINGEKSEEQISVENIQKEVEELKELINKTMKNNLGENQKTQNLEEKEIAEKEKKDSEELIKKLKDIDIDEQFYDDIIKLSSEYKDDDLNETEILRDIFERDILVINKELKGKVVLVGPTGVGKTTTIAKLAGRLALIEKKKVGLITIDTYRIGAVEQLKTYAEIMNIPFKVVITIKEMEDAIESMKECDIILIDTTGRSSKNTMQISELRAFVQKAEPDYTAMVISATTKNKDISSILKGYSELEYGSVIITKLDETTSYGSIYNISRNSNKPISFITTGQNVPDDIRVSTKEELTRFILGEETLC